ncbi:MAG: GvpL/GvpF family gas vesicle protein [Vicinamibacteria bacterium]
MSAATYAYGLLERAAAPAVAKAPAGPPGLGPLRALPVREGLWLLVAAAPLARYGAEAIDRGLQDLDWVSRCALGHERVVESFLGAGTLLPMKLFTLFTGDEAALARAREDPPRVARLLRRLRGKSEWGVRLRRSGAAPVARAAKPAKSGREFLQRKLAERTVRRGTTAEDRGAADRVFRELKRATAAAVRKPIADDAGRLLLDAVFLATGAEASALRRAVAARARAVRAEGLELVLTGPWPAYHFLGGTR